MTELTNEYGAELDRCGYAESILQPDTYCWLCGATVGKLDRHEVFHAAYRQKSKRLGLWVLLCHEKCHLYGVHVNAKKNLLLKRYAQEMAMGYYDWSTEDFIKQFGKNYLED